MLGVSSFSGINFNLATLLQDGHDLSSLVAPFGKYEIDLVIKNLATDKAPGLDGFNANFVKKNVGTLFVMIFTIYVMLFT